MEPAFTEFRLPPGNHGLTPKEVAENQRWRLLGAAAEVVAEQGYLHATTAGIARCASVSRSTFYVHFNDLGDCLLAAHETVADGVLELIAVSCDADQEWEARLRTVIDAVLEFFAAEPPLAALLGSELASGVPEIAEARTALIERLCPLLAAGRGVREQGLPEAIESHLVAGALSMTFDRTPVEKVGALPALAPALVELLAAPYRG